MSEGPISAEQVRECARFHKIEPFNTDTMLNEEATACELNALVRPLIEAAVASAQAEMRERCAAKMRTLNDEFWSAVAARDCESVPLSPESDAWLRRVVEVAIDEGARWSIARDEMIVAADMELPMPTYASILAEAAKEPPRAAERT